MSESVCMWAKESSIIFTRDENQSYQCESMEEIYMEQTNILADEEKKYRLYRFWQLLIDSRFPNSEIYLRE